jgi:hypothetical protein
MLVERVPYPEGFPQERRTLIEVAIDEAEERLDNSALDPGIYNWESELPLADASVYVEAIVLAFATSCVHAVLSGQLPLSELERMREEFLLGIIERVYKIFEGSPETARFGPDIDGLPCNEEFRLAIEEIVRDSKHWKFHLAQVKELKKTGGLPLS